MMAVWSEVNFSNTTEDLRLDSEYYQPEHLRLDHLHREMGSPLWGTLGGNFIVGPFGSAFLVENYVEKSMYRYIRGRDVKPFFLLDDKNCYMPEDHFNRLRKYELQPGDLLVSVVGTLGNVSVVTEDTRQAVFSCKSTAYRPKRLDPYYLCAYLNTEIGQSYLQRMVRGHVQTGLNLSDLKQIPILVPEESVEKKIGDIVRRAYSKHNNSKDLYAQAERLLLSELRLEDLDLSPTLFYERPFSETRRAARLNAEFFQPKYYTLLERLNQCASLRDGSTIGSISKPLKYGTSDKLSYVEEGVPFLRIANLENNRFEEASVLRISDEEASRQENARVSTGDVLISRSGTLGLAVAIPDYLANSVFGSYFIRVRPDCRVIHPEFLALYINALCGAMQVERLNTGGIQTNLTIPAIESMFVVHGDMPWQMRFVEIVMKSVAARDESRRLLEEAKQMVQKAVLRGGH